MKRQIILLILCLTAMSGWGQSRYKKYIEKAKQGDAVAQREVGLAYALGEGVAKDYAQAGYWYRKAAEQGDKTAQRNLGLRYKNGEGVAKDYGQALYWFRKAAEQGQTDAQTDIGLAYYNGQGVVQDYAQAVEWFRKAAEQGLAGAQFNLGVCYYRGEGVTKDYAQAVYWYRKAAEQGDKYAQRGLGLRYNNGEGVPKDYEQALYWFRKAAEQGYTDAQNDIGLAYYNGQGVAQDYAQAVYWFRKAAEQGNKYAQNNLAYRYKNGQGVTKDLEQAKYWFSKSADQGYETAKKGLAEVEELLRQKNLAANSQPKTTVTPTPKPVQTQPVKQQTPVQTVSPSAVDMNIPAAKTVDKNTFAVIVGNEKYRNEAEVPFAENDARVFKEYVQKTLGVPEKQIRFVANAGLNDLRGAVRWLSQAMDVCGGQGRAIFYYAGHGIPDEAEKTAYLLPVDGYGSDVESGYSISRLYAELGKMPAERVTVFLDACFSGAKREGGMMASARAVAIKVKPSTPQGKLVVFTAAQEDETAFPYKEQKHGMFTYYLLKKLQDTRGEVTLGELGDYLTSEVKRQSFVENNKVQTPTVTSSATLGTSWKNMRLK